MASSTIVLSPTPQIEWQCRTVPMKFRFSDWTFFSFPLRVTTQATLRVFEALAHEAPVVPHVAPHEGTEGYLLRSLPIRDDLPRLSAVDGFLRYVPLQYQHGYIDLRTSFADYQRRFSPKTRQTIQRKVRRYTEHCGGRLTWRTFRAPGEMREFVRQARTISKRTYQERLAGAGLPDSESFVAGAEARAAHNQVRGYILFDGELPVSYMYCPIEDGVVMYGHLGFDPSYFDWSVGTILLWLAIEQLYEEQTFHYFDFTEGQSEHKRRFATHHRRCANVLLLRPSARNLALVLGQCAIDALSTCAARTLDRFNLRIKIRRLLRVGTSANSSSLPRVAEEDK
jgi:hypothetical protein